MNESWSMDDQMMESPMASEGHQNNLFHISPPTPQNFPSTLPAPPQYDHHLRPSDSSYSLRSHRSVSSVGSMDSHASMYSGMTRWSTLTASDSVSSGPDPFDGVQNPFHARTASLSIDPKLFQMKEKSPDEVDEMPTAVPPAPKSTMAKKGKGQTSPGRKKISHARKQHPEHIPRPRNAFILFRKHVVDAKLIPASVEMRHQNVSIITAKMWSEAPPEQKKHFNELARIEKEEHLKKYPGYRYQPVYRRTNVIRRRVRKDDAEEEKCRSVAELLLKGKSGASLESEIKHKIKRGPASSSGSSKRDKSASRGSSGAIELSKGALRALRAQARQQSMNSSGEWSDASRDNSLDPTGGDYEPDSKMGQESPEQGDMQYLPEGMHPQPYFTSIENSSMGYTHPDMTGWAFAQPRNNQDEQGYTYPAAPHFSQNMIPQENGVQQYTYPQPPRPLPINLPASDFYTYDQALPFSPNTHANAEASGSHHFIPSDMVFTGYPTEGPSPTSAMYGAIGRPMSARWDRANHILLPPSSEMAFEGFPFDEGGLLLHDFEAALAQADDMANAW